MKKIEKMQKSVDVFNEICQPGDSVIVKKDNGEVVRTTLKYPAQVLSGHTPVAWANGISGCYALDRFTIANDAINLRSISDKAHGVTKVIGR